MCFVSIDNCDIIFEIFKLFKLECFFYNKTLFTVDWLYRTIATSIQPLLIDQLKDKFKSIVNFDIKNLHVLTVPMRIYLCLGRR